MSSKELWRLPGQSMPLGRAPHLTVLSANTCWLEIEVEGVDGSPSHCSLILSGVESYRCTLPSSVSAEMAIASGERLAEIEPSNWLAEIESARRGTIAPCRGAAPSRH